MTCRPAVVAAEGLDRAQLCAMPIYYIHDHASLTPGFFTQARVGACAGDY